MKLDREVSPERDCAIGHRQTRTFSTGRQIKPSCAGDEPFATVHVDDERVITSNVTTSPRSAIGHLGTGESLPNNPVHDETQAHMSAQVSTLTKSMSAFDFTKGGRRSGTKSIVIASRKGKRKTSAHTKRDPVLQTTVGLNDTKHKGLQPMDLDSDVSYRMEKTCSNVLCYRAVNYRGEPVTIKNWANSMSENSPHGERVRFTFINIVKVSWSSYKVMDCEVFDRYDHCLLTLFACLSVSVCALQRDVL